MFQQKHVGLILAIATLPAAAAAQEASPSGQIRFSGPAMAPGGARVPAGAAACNNSVESSTSLATIKRYQMTFVGALVEYNTGTCAQITPGKWKGAGQKCEPPSGSGANCGEVSYGTLTGLHLENGDCPGNTYSFAAICYTWNAHNNWEVTDKISATWTAQDFVVSYQFPLTVPIVYPSSETTAAKGWDPQGRGKWEQKLSAASDPKFDWSWNSVQEMDPGPDVASNDSCWFSGSQYAPFYKITGGTWYGPPDSVGDFGPEKNAMWGYDHVGWFTTAVQYYRSKGRAPCGTHFPQQMQFQATQVSTAWVNYAGVNNLGGYFTAANVLSQRAGQSETRKVAGAAPPPLQAFNAVFPATPASPALGASVVVSDPRPLAAAIQEIERLSGTPITYEDPPFSLNPYYVTPMAGDRSGNPELLIPKGGSLLVAMPTDASAAQALAAAQNAVASYNARLDVATFAVSQDGLAHVVPRQTVDLSGQRVAVTPVLDARITLAAQPRSAMDLLEAICQAVSVASGQTVKIGTVPGNALDTRRTAFGADNEPARNVLEKLIAATGKPMSWLLFYDPGLKDYALNMAEVERPAAQP